MGILPGEEKDDHAVFLENYLNTSITRNSDGSYTRQNSLGRKMRLHFLRIIQAAQGAQEPWSVALLTRPISLKPTMTSSRRWKGEVL